MKDMEEIIKNVLLSRSSGKYSTQWKADTFNLLFKISVKCGPMVSLVRLNEYSTSMCKFWNLQILAHLDNIRGAYDIHVYIDAQPGLKLKTIRKCFSVPIKGISQCYASLHCLEYGHKRTRHIYNTGKMLYRRIEAG